MASKSFSEALTNLSSEKIKDRAQGLEDVRIFLSVARNIDWISQEKRQWLRLLQSIFQIVVDEQKAYERKSGAASSAALKRLKDAAHVVRVIVDLASSSIPRKTFKAILNHITSILIYNKQLFEPIALEYIKALRSILSYRPHLDHLEEKQWVVCVSMCLSAVLGDPIRAHELVEDRMADDEEDSEMTETAASSSTHSRKRKAIDPLRMTQRDHDDVASPRPTNFRSAGQEIIEIMSCIDLLFNYSNAPFLIYGQVLLTKLLRFLRAFPNETSAHTPCLNALNALLSEVFYNDRAFLEQISIQMWSSLLALWPTKNQLLKEQLIMSFTSLLPFLLHQPGTFQADLISQLYESILAEPENRWGSEELDLNCLAISDNQNCQSKVAFALRNFRAGHRFSAEQALSWSTMELAAACLSYIQNASQTLQADVPITAPSSRNASTAKRRKTPDVIQTLLDDLNSSNARVVLARLQLFVFYLDTLGTTPDLELVNQLLTSIQPLLSHTSISIQNWTFILAASLASLSAVNDTPADYLAPTLGDEPAWLTIWVLALRRMNLASTCRTACYAANVLYDCKRVDTSRMLLDLENVARDIEMQGPPVPSDAVCQFLTKLLQLSASDARLYEMRTAERVYNRITNEWRLNQHHTAQTNLLSTKGPAEPLDVIQLLHLLGEVSAMQVPRDMLPSEIVLPDSPLVKYQINKSHQQPLFNWFFLAKLPDTKCKNELLQQKNKPTETVGYTSTSTKNLPVRCAMYLRRELEAVLDELENAAPTYWVGLSVERFRRILDIAVVAILFEALSEERNIVRHERGFSLATRILGLVFPRIQDDKFTSRDRAYILLALTPICLPFKKDSSEYEAMNDAGETSGIRRSMLPIPAVHGNMIAPFLRTLWLQRPFITKMGELLIHIRGILSADAYLVPTDTVEEEDGFGTARTASSSQSKGHAICNCENDEAISSYLSTSVRLLTTHSYFAEGGTHPVRQREIAKELVEGSGLHLILVGRHVLKAVSAGYITLSAIESEELLEKIGGELLPSYEYARSQDMQQLVLQFLAVTIREWGTSRATESAFVDNARKLSAWFTAQLWQEAMSSHRIRNALIDLLAMFLDPELDQSTWGHESEEHSRDDGQSIPPINILIDFLKDPDFRTRFKLAPVLGRLCSYVQGTHTKASGIWTLISGATGFSITANGFEQNTTLLLAYGNIIVASQDFRSFAYSPITTYAALSTLRSTSTYIRNLLNGIAHRLGLSSSADLFTLLAPYTMAQNLRHGQEDLTIPDPTAFGFTSQRELYEANFAEVASMVLARSKFDFFQRMCTFVRKSYASAEYQCLPIYTAYMMTMPRSTGLDVGKEAAAEQNIADMVSRVAEETGQTVHIVLSSMQDLVLARTFSLVWEPSYEMATFEEAFRQDWPTALKCLRQMFSSMEAFYPDNLSPPEIHLQTVLSVVYTEKLVYRGALRNEAVLYSALHHLLSWSATPPFVSQQRRLLYNSAILIACASETIAMHSSLMGLILQRLLQVMAQPDLVQIATQIFRWTLQAYSTLSKPMGAAVDYARLLLAGAEVACRMQSDSDTAIRQAGKALMVDLQRCLTLTMNTEDSATKNIAAEASYLWPTILPIHSNPNLQHMLQIFSTNRLSFTNSECLKRLLKALQNSKKQGTIIAESLLSRLLWQFLQDLPVDSVESIKLEVCEALADLLYVAGGAIKRPPLNELRDKDKPGECDLKAVHHKLVEELVRMLKHRDLSVVSKAFDAIRLTFSVSKPTDMTFTSEEMHLIASEELKRPPPVPKQSDGVSLTVLIQGSEWVKRAEDRKKWQHDFASFLVTFLSGMESLFGHLLPMCMAECGYAEAILPSLVHATLLGVEGASQHARSVISAYFKRLLDSHSPCTEDIVKIVVHLRGHQAPSTSTTSLSRNGRLDISWLELAKAATRIGLYTTSLLFLELGLQHKNTNHANETAATDAELDARQLLLYEVYSNLDEPDGFYSVKPRRPYEGLIKRLHHEDRWLDAMTWHGAAMEGSTSLTEDGNNTAGLILSMSSMDLGRMAIAFYGMNRGAHSAALPEGIAYDLAWRTEQWDLPLTYQQGKNSSFANVFWALRASQRNLNLVEAGTISDESLRKEFLKVRITPSENRTVSEPAIKGLVAIRQVQSWLGSGHPTLEKINRCFSDASALPFPFFEYIINIRLSLLKGLRESERKRVISDEPIALASKVALLERSYLLQLSRRARESGQMQSALNAVLKAQHLMKDGSEDFEVLLEMAQVMWCKGEYSAGIDCVQDLLQQTEKGIISASSEQRAMLLSWVGAWVATARLETATSIQYKYFEKASILAETRQDGTYSRQAGEVFYRYALFANEQYQLCNKQLPEMEKLEAFSIMKQHEAQSLTRTKAGSESNSDRTRSRNAETQSQQDRQTVLDFRTARQGLLETALLMLGRVLASSDNHDNMVFRFCSLWLENFATPGVIEKAALSLQTIPSYKFVGLIHQLSARLSTSHSTHTTPSSHDSLQAILHQLVTRLCADHPYHTLFQIYFLRQSGSKGKTTSANRRTSQQLPEIASQIRRTEAVGEVLQNLRKQERLSRIISQMEIVISAYTEWAHFPAEKSNRAKKKTIPADLKILRLADIPVPISTVVLPIDKTCTYPAGSMPCIRRFVPLYTTAGGIHLPKITDCVGSDGRTYRQLYKGGDDVRQDAVMEQVFVIANELLQRDERSKARSLAIRTYKVIPLTPDAGLLQFVPRSRAIGEWLIPAHGRYNPKDMPISEARRRLLELQNAPAPERVEAYKDIMTKVHPVMRHFFFENHYIPSRWFEMRLLYSRSAAVVSMVGHILGLGDRHVSNIMIDNALGELIPIDLGIAFEGGKMLPTPELVPFRLTPDIIDGFGMSGVEGVFRKCSEETMRVLRHESSVLMTILEVFKFDPLQKWTVSSQKAKRIQGSQAVDNTRGTEGQNSDLLTDADRAIKTVAEKLRNDLSVEYQVNDFMILEDIREYLAPYEGVKVDDIERAPNECLQALLTVLETSQSDRAEHALERQRARQREEYFQASIISLTSQNAVLNARLLASLDSLDVVNYRLNSDDIAKENEALRLLNSSLASRVQDVQGEVFRLRVSMAEYNARENAANTFQEVGRASMQTAQVIRDLYPEKKYPSARTNNELANEDSDTSTELKKDHPNSAFQRTRHSLTASPSQERLRIRTIVEQLIDELSRARREVQITQAEKQEVTTLLQSHLENRDKEIASLYSQLGLFYGISGFTLQNHLKGVDTTEDSLAEGNVLKWDHVGQSTVLDELADEIYRLKEDVVRLSNERNNVMKYATQSLGMGDTSGNLVHKTASYEQGAHSDGDAFENLAIRAQTKLLEQKEALNRARSENAELQKSLHDTQEVARKATTVLEEMSRSRRLVESPMRDFGYPPQGGGTLSTEEFPRRPRSADSLIRNHRRHSSEGFFGHHL